MRKIDRERIGDAIGGTVFALARIEESPDGEVAINDKVATIVSAEGVERAIESLFDSVKDGTTEVGKVYFVPAEIVAVDDDGGGPLVTCRMKTGKEFKSMEYIFKRRT